MYAGGMYAGRILCALGGSAREKHSLRKTEISGIDKFSEIIYKSFSISRNKNDAESISLDGHDVHVYGHGVGSNDTPDGASLST